MAQRTWPLIGQKNAIDFFEQTLDYEQQHPGTLGGSFILSGPTSVGKGVMLESFLSHLSRLAEGESAPADIVRLELLEEKREIGIAQAREFSGRLALSTFGGHYRIGVVHNAELLSIEAANALLKTLEDARDQVIIFLLTSSRDLLPATIRSRSQHVMFKTLPADEIYEWLIRSYNLTRPQAKNISRLSGGRPGLALKLATDKKFLEQRLVPVQILCAAFKTPLYERWQAIVKFIGNSTGAEAVAKAAEALESWRLTVRDLLLMRLNQPELVIHAFAEEELRAALRSTDMQDLRRYDGIIQQAIRYLKANVNPKLVLEQVLMNIH